MNLKLVSAILLCGLLFGGAAIAWAVSIITYAPSNDVPLTVDPSPTPTPTQVSGTVALTGSATTIVHGGAYTLTAQLTPASITTVTFYNGQSQIGQSTSDGSGVASLLLPNLAPGTYLFHAEATQVTTS